MRELTETEKTIKRQIKEMRLKEGKSCYQVAKDIKIDAGNYHRLEECENQYAPTFPLLERLSKYYEVQITDFLTDSPAKEDINSNKPSE